MLEGNTTHVVVTPNPEMLLIAREHAPYKETLAAADLAVPDGVGIQVAVLLRSRRWVRRYAGVDLGELLLELAHERRLPVLFLGGRNGNAISAAERLTKAHSNLRIYASADNVEVSESGEIPDPKEERRVRDGILQSKPAVIFVGLGAPKQEEWMLRHKNDFPSVRIMIGIGGAFDIWSGRLHRAPRLFRRLGLEWLWRLTLQPWRLLRVVRAVLLFPLLAVFNRADDHA